MAGPVNQSERAVWRVIKRGIGVRYSFDEVLEDAIAQGKILGVPEDRVVRLTLDAFSGRSP